MDTVPDDKQTASSSRALSSISDPPGPGAHHDVINAAGVRPSVAQRRYLERGLEQPGGKLPLFDRDGREVPRKTVEACVAHGWAEPWAGNPIKPDWPVCRLIAPGYRVLGRMPPERDGE